MIIAMLLAGGPAYADAIRNDQWYLTFLNLSVAQRHSQGDGVTVALIDTGVDARHPDLQRSVQPGIDIVHGGTGDGRADADGHGTGMASLIAGHGRGPSDGILGIAPKARVLPVRISTATHTGDTNDTARAVDWAVQHGARVICVPNGGGISVELLRAVDRARRLGIVVVAAAGNRPTATGVLVPASFPGVIAAAAVDRNGNHHPDSVTGPEIVLAAPGVGIVSASKNGGYRDGTGTSDASAIIAGAVALVRARYPDLSADQVIRRLTATATDKGPPGRDEQYGYGVLNLVAALTADIPGGSPSKPTASIAAPPTEGTRGLGLVPLLAVLIVAAGAVTLVIARNRRGRHQ